MRCISFILLSSALCAPAFAQVQVGSGASAAPGGTAVGDNSTAGPSATAEGDNASATGVESVAIGKDANATGDQNIAIGKGAQATGVTDSIAIGQQANSSGLQAIAVGVGSDSTGDWSSAFGMGASSQATDSTAIGSRSLATGNNSVALGARSSDGGQANVVSIGSPTQTRRIIRMSAGLAPTDGVNVSQLTPLIAALGGGASFNNTTGAVTGPTYVLSSGSFTDVGSALANLDTRVTAATVPSYVAQAGAPGAGNTAQMTIGANTGGSSISVANASGGDRTITNVAPAALNATSTDAVNGAQLYATNQQLAANTTAVTNLQTTTSTNLTAVANSLGGGATYNTTTNTFTGPTYNVAGGTQTDVGAALTALDNAITNAAGASANAVQYDSAAHDRVTLGGAGAAGPVALANVQAGALTATSTDAVNGSQLYATNQQVAANTTNFTNLTNSINNGTIGLVQQAGGLPTGDILVGPNTGGTVVNMSGTGGARRVTGVANGQVAAGSTDAINGGQLYALETSWNNKFDAINYDLNDLNKKLDGGLAGVAAMGALPQAVNPGRFVIGVSTSVRGGRAAAAVGLSARSNDDRFVFNVRAGFDDKTTVAVGAGIEF